MSGERPDHIDSEFRVVDAEGNPQTEFSTAAKKDSPSRSEYESQDLYDLYEVQPFAEYKDFRVRSRQEFQGVWNSTFEDSADNFPPLPRRKWWRFWEFWQTLRG